MFDSHIHLTDAAFDADRAEVIARARDAGVRGFLTLGTDLATSRAAVALAEREPDVYAAVGIHPTEVAAARPEDREAVRRLAEEHRLSAGLGKVAAIGETGLDYYWDATTAEAQKESLRWHLALARDLDLPVVLHNRSKPGGPSSHRDLVLVLEEFAAAHGGQIRGILHCFSGEAWYREAGARLGLHFGFGGPITYRNSRGPDDMRLVPADRLLLETDAPYLAPVPHRGKRNEPARIRLVLERTAEVLGRGAEEIDALTTVNARRLFGVA